MGFTENKKKIQFLRGVAWFFSIVFHPILLASWLFLIISFYAPLVLNPITQEGRKTLLIIIFISTCLLPLLILLTMLLLFKNKVSWSDLIINKKEKRIMPFIFSGIYYLTLSYTMFSQLNRMMYILMLTISLLIVVLGIITVFWKISAHSLGLGGLIGLMLMIAHMYPTADMLPPVITTVLISGFVISSRLMLHAHNGLQVFGGFITGFIVSISGFYLIVSL